MTAVGYAVGYGLGDRIERLRRATGHVEVVVIALLVLGAIGMWVVRVRRARSRAAGK
jgi:membrane protein DedA with SNARE-associated domain